MPKKYIVTLTDEERLELEKMIRSGKAPARKLIRARILLKADSADGRQGWSDAAICQALDVSSPTVWRTRKRFVMESFEAALNSQRPGRHYKRKLDGQQEAHLIAIACSQPPEGRQRWTLRLLRNRMIELKLVETVSHETIREVLKKTNSSPGSSNSGASRRSRTPSLFAAWRTCLIFTHGLMTANTLR